MRIFIAQIVKREADAGEEAGGFGNRLRAVAEQAGHLGGWFQVAFGIGGQPSPRLRDAGLFTDAGAAVVQRTLGRRSEEHTSALQSLMRISYAVFCLKKKKNHT